MLTYLIDENMPFLSCWDKERFIHVNDINNIHSDSNIWEYALKNRLTIITKDTDFYYRYLSSQKNPKVVWIRINNMKKRVFLSFVARVWDQIEDILLTSSFIIITEDKIERY